MSSRGKSYLEALEKVDRKKEYEVGEAISLLKNTASANFVETAEISLKLGVDPRHADQQVRGTVVLPNGTGKSVKILALTTSKIEEAEEAGADYVGEDYLAKIKGGWLDFDLVIATPEMMPKLGRLGKILGPKGLMPNPKSGTVTEDIGKAVKEFKKGKLAFKVDKFSLINVPFGKVDFSEEALTENFTTFIEKIIELRPNETKGQYIKKISISLTMGPGIKLDPLSILKNF
ncbi:MAG: 50S ribosomal protein L1 [Fusobacteriota bacterium]